MNPPLEFAAAIALPVAAVYALIGGARLLKRMSAEAMETRGDLPAKNLRLQALRTAYVDALKDACQRLDVSVPASARVRPEGIRQSDIYRMEAGLRARGLDVRETAGR